MEDQECPLRGEPVVSKALHGVCGIPSAGVTASIKFSCDEKFARIVTTDMEAGADIAAAVACHHIPWPWPRGISHSPFQKSVMPSNPLAA